MMSSPGNYSVIAGAMVLDAYLLYIFFSRRKWMAADPRPAGVAVPLSNGPPADANGSRPIFPSQPGGP